MQRFQIELVIGLDRHKAHVLPRDRLGDSFGVEKVVLVRLEKGFYELRRNQPGAIDRTTSRAEGERWSALRF